MSFRANRRRVEKSIINRFLYYRALSRPSGRNDDDEEEAARVFDKEAKKRRGEFAVLNFPDDRQ